MINFTVSIGNMINIIIIAVGLGICGMIVMQVSSGTRLRKEVSRYFQLFFGTVMLYIGSHLLRQLMEGFPGARRSSSSVRLLRNHGLAVFPAHTVHRRS